MAKEYAKVFYKSVAWTKCKNTYIKARISIDGGMCEECHVNLGYIVHHKQKLTKDNIKDPDVALNHRNLEYVCKQCHDKFEGHGVSRKVKSLCMFDKDGQPISLREIDKHIPP